MAQFSTGHCRTESKSSELVICCYFQGLHEETCTNVYVYERERERERGREREREIITIQCNGKHSKHKLDANLNLICTLHSVNFARVASNLIGLDVCTRDEQGNR